MLDNIQRTNTEEDAKLCHQLLSAVTLAVRPLGLFEVVIIAGLPLEMNEYDLETQIRQCGPFLIVQDKTVLSVHQSAQDFLNGNGSESLNVLETSTLGSHYSIVKICLNRLSKELRMDICSLKIPGFHIKGLNPEQTLHINHLKYACYYWVHHLNEGRGGRQK